MENSKESQRKRVSHRPSNVKKADCFLHFIGMNYQKMVKQNFSFNFRCIYGENMSMKMCAWNVLRELIDPCSSSEDVIYWVL